MPIATRRVHLVADLEALFSPADRQMGQDEVAALQSAQTRIPPILQRLMSCCFYRLPGRRERQSCDGHESGSPRLPHQIMQAIRIAWFGAAHVTGNSS